MRDLDLVIAAARSMTAGHHQLPSAPSAEIITALRALVPEALAPDGRFANHLVLDSRIPVSVGSGGAPNHAATNEVRDYLGVASNAVMVIRVGDRGLRGDASLDAGMCGAILHGSYLGLIGAVVRPAFVDQDSVRIEPASARPAAANDDQGAGGPYIPLAGPNLAGVPKRETPMASMTWVMVGNSEADRWVLARADRSCRA